MKGTALVTGAADRIGAAIACGLAAAGHAVVIHYHSAEAKAAALAQTITREGGTAGTVRADLLDRAERAGLIAAASGIFGPPDILINNASRFERDSLETLAEDYWDLHMGLHAEAPVFLARDFAARLPAGRKGNIVNIIDERVLHVSPDHFSYTLSKMALWHATRTLAQSLAPRVRVNAIGPGPTLRNARQSDTDFEASVRRLPLGTGPSPKDIADAVLMFIGMPTVTGQILALDGGEHLQWLEKDRPTPRPSERP